MLAYYTIDWRKFHVHRRRDLRDRGVAKFDRMWFFAFIYIKDNKIPRIVAFVGSELHLLAVNYSEKHFSFVVNTAEK